MMMHAEQPVDDRTAAPNVEADDGPQQARAGDFNQRATVDDQAEGMERDVDALRDEIAQAQDRALRLQAELENFRARMRREMDEERRYALLPLVRDLLPALDNVSRAIEAAEREGETTGLLEGFKLVAQQIDTVLAQHQCRRIDALHQPFDPHRHQAISQQPSDEHPHNTVLHVAQAGYELNGRVVRPAQVIVSVAPLRE